MWKILVYPPKLNQTLLAKIWTRDLWGHVLLGRSGGSTVKEVKATTTRSPTCNRVALASGFGRVAMMDFVAWLSGGWVVR